MKHKKKYLGLALVLLGLAGATIAVRPLLDGPSRAEETAGPSQPVEDKAVPVSVTPAREVRFTDLLKTQGNLESVSYAEVPAKLSGTLEAVYVEEGDRVEAGKTRLFKTDSLKLEKTFEIRRHELSVAKYALKEKQALLEQIEADLHKAELDYKRYQRLQSNGSVSADALEQHQSRYHQILATRKHALALIDLSAEKVRKAQAALAIAGKDLEDAVVLAPLDGVVSRRFKEPGEMGGTSDPVVKIENTGVLEISAFMPARYYPLVIPGQTEASVEVHGLDLGRLPVAHKSPTIDAKLRTFEIKCRLDNTSGRLAPGAMAQVEVILRSHRGLGIPREALVVRQERPAVFLVQEDRARLVFVETGLETDGWMEVKGSEPAPGSAVVTSGQAMLNPGTKVRVTGETN